MISEGIRKYYYKNPPNSSYQEGFDHGLDKAQRVILNAPVADAAEDGYMIKEDKVTVSKTFMFDNIECLHEIRYRAIRDEDDNIKYYEKQVIC